MRLFFFFLTLTLSLLPRSSRIPRVPLVFPFAAPGPPAVLSSQLTSISPFLCQPYPPLLHHLLLASTLPPSTFLNRRPSSLNFYAIMPQNKLPSDSQTTLTELTELDLNDYEEKQNHAPPVVPLKKNGALGMGKHPVISWCRVFLLVCCFQSVNTSH